MSGPPPFLSKLRARLGKPMSGLVGHVASFAAGLVMALVLFYVLYRIGLPSKPFIYVSF